jgi:outer membrane protein OmpA-like peptidoglycan-associated protein/tetratricopeptide (TPR) repeat protein
MTQKVISKIVLVLVMMLGMSFFSFGQLNRANKHFEQEEFSEAIIYYHKALKKDASNKNATQNLAFSYRKLKDYTNAEIYYARATTLNPSEGSNFLYYGQALKNNNKLKEAKNQFEKFVTQNPSSFIGKLMVQSCGDIKDWEVEEKEFEVTAVDNINTKDADFCPLVYEGGIVFVSERGVDLVNTNHSGMANKPYLSLYYAKKEKQYKKAKHFSNQLSSLYHDGPVSISENGDEIYFTRADKRENGKSYINRLQIFSAKLDGKKWKNITPFKYNSEDYSIAHPWLSKGGNQLFFASDMPGGYGGMDIYVCKKEDGNWSKPFNLGEGVNTSENEVFPYFRKGVLYFSSEGHSGYGGLDVFVTKETEKWRNAENLKAPLNSSKDDFGIFYTDDESGYFSSDREGGVGSDDIYAFSWHAIEPKTQMTGVLEYDKLGASGTSINLLDEEDHIIETTVTDEFGKFKFDKLDLDKNYILAIDSDDDSFLEEANLYLTNSKGEKVILAQKAGKGRFKFQALPYEYYDGLDLLDETDDNILTAEVFGQLYKTLPGDYSDGMEVWVVDDEGNIIGRSKTNQEGFFSFDKLSQEEQYLFMLAEDDPKINMIILNENGAVLDAAKRLIDGKYRYSRLGSDENVLALMNEEDETIAFVNDDSVSTVNIFGQLYNKLPGDYSGIKEIWVVDDEGNIVRKTNTDSKGFFAFDKLPGQDEILFMLAEDDENIHINIVDEGGKYLGTAKRLIDAKYRYSRLGSDSDSLDLMSENDESTINVNNMLLTTEAKYDYKSSKLLNAGKKELDKLIVVLKSNKGLGIEIGAHTDSKGGPTYNQKLGQQRANEAVRYLVSSGVPENRINAKSYGQSKPIAPNKLSDGSDNPEGRAKNRRVEFKIFKLK